MDDTKKWYQSSGVWGSVGSVMSFVLIYFGYNVEGMQEMVTSSGLALGGAIAALVGLYGRIKASKRIG